MSKLILIPTPIGNLEDITLRAIRMLNESDIILAEDTRKTGILLKHFEIKKPMIAHHKFNEHNKLQTICDMILSGKQVALVSDAGTPSISDPGFLLVRKCIEEGIEVECLPGATALIPALAVSGIPNDRFVFEGFLPAKKGRATKLQILSSETRTMVFYESPHRLIKTLNQFIENFGENRKAAICREISKIHEETVRGTLKELVLYYSNNTLKGEIVIIIEGNL
ncbi:MAG: 16S rRNA (cytidine(1402)-2'-O)-methyltransferase [Bacteroidales bacterium]|jgi:16S rRNA (cytidine1402-2'-O)-methyltransferase|nr:16S rRNA (cytidine(1402)-2'-O)-methyltransferase [Bacteroidales bacterium]